MDSRTSRRASQVKEFWLRYKRNRLAVVGLVLSCLFVLVAVMAGMLSPFDPMRMVGHPFLFPDYGHLMGTDNLGRDVCSGVLYGARISLLVGFLAAATSIGLGVVVGGLGGFFGGIVDNVLMRLTELFMVIPRLFLALILVALFGASVWNTIFVIGILSWPTMARLVRAEFLSLKDREFVLASRAVGSNNYVLIFHEILPNALPSIIVNGSLEVAKAILTEAGLSFLGLGDPRVPSWGVMLGNAQQFIRNAWWMALFPGLAIFLVVLGLNLFGDGLNDALNPRLKQDYR